METFHDLGEIINAGLVQASNLPCFLNSTSGTNGTVLTDRSRALHAEEPRGVGQINIFQADTCTAYPWSAVFL